MPPSLLDYLCSALQANLAGRHPNLVLNVLRSDPTRSHALFPHATNARSVRVYHEDIFVVLSEPVPVPVPVPDSLGSDLVVPVVGIEAALYTVPATGTALLYISKVDTTGLVASSSSRPSPTRPLVAAFLAYFLVHPPHNCSRVRIHVFARAQSQYLFPGSVDNHATKKILDDKALIRWWKRTLETAVAQSTTPTAETRLFYLIPGLAYLESLPYVPATATSAKVPQWTYSHPYAALSSPLHPAADPPSAHPLVDHIPAFPDDPKSRFLHSLTSSSVAASGTEGDYDDAFLAVASNSFSTGQTPAQKLLELERAVDRERKRLIQGVPGGVDEWWERMAFRQECCAGQLVGFFVVAAGEPSPSTAAATAATAADPQPNLDSDSITLDSLASRVDSAVERPTQPSPAHGPTPRRHPLSLRPSTYTKLWSQLHNFDYALSAMSKLGQAVAKWEQGLEHALKAEEDLDGGDELEPIEPGARAALDNQDRGESPNAAATAVGPAIGGDDSTEQAAAAAVLARRSRAEREWQRRYEKFVRREFTVDNNPIASTAAAASSMNGNGDGTAEGGEGGRGGKRTAEEQQQQEGGGGNGEEAPKVNVLAPRKKKKKTEVHSAAGPLPPA
ncbi:hypothetical protein JCM3774_005587 [Rhodotorula dairenensis]